MSRQHTARSLSSVSALLAFSSGASALSLEVLWIRSLSVEVGSPLAAFTIVICSFLAGLSAGAAIFGRIADRTGNPAWAFASAQALVGAAALGSALMAAAGGLTRGILLALAPSPDQALFTVTRALVSGSTVFLPAILMGGTVPLLLKVPGAKDTFPRRCGILAGANAAGAALGSMACGFVLLPALGLSRSLAASALLCAATAGGAWLLGLCSRGRKEGAPVNRPAPRSPAGPPPGGGAITGRCRVLLTLFATGLALTALEVVWTRLARLAFGSSVQAGSLVLTAVISGVALGNGIGARIAGRTRVAASVLSTLACASALATLATEPLIGRLPLLAAGLDRWTGGSEAGQPLLVQNALTTALTVLPCALIGAAFPVGFRALTDSRPGSGREGREAGAASSSVSAGNFLGAPLAYFGILGHAGTRACLLGAAAVLAAASLLSGTSAARRAAGILALLVIGAVGLAGTWDQAIMSSGPFVYGDLYAAVSKISEEGSIARAVRSRGDVIFSSEGPHALVTVRRQGDGLLSLQVNGKTDASTGGDMKTQTLMAQLPLLVGPRSAVEGEALVIGLGSGVTAASALTHPVKAVSVIEISPEVVEAARFFEAANRGALADPRLKLIMGDARSRLLFSPERYDLVISQPSNPWIAGEAILFTREFFELARSRLKPGGMMCQWLQGYGLTSDDFRSVVATFGGVFSHVSLWEESTAGGDYLLLGSETPLELDPAEIVARMGRPPVAADLARIEVSDLADLLSHFVLDDGAVGRFARDAQLQTEDRLELEFTAPRALRSENLGEILSSLEAVRADPSGQAWSLSGGEALLAAELARRAREAKREREWVAGLGLLSGGAADLDLLQAIGYLRAGMKRHAFEAVSELALQRPADRLPHLLLAHLSMSAGRMEDAVRELEAAVALDAEEPSLRLFLSRALYASGDVPAALLHNIEASRLAPALAEPHSDRCAMLVTLGDLPSAEAACREAIDRDADLSQAHANLGVVHSRRARLEEAEAAYRTALDLDPSLLDARFNLASLLERRGRSREGLEVLVPGLSRVEALDGEALRLAARLAAGTGDTARALEFLEASLGVEPGNSEARALVKELEH